MQNNSKYYSKDEALELLKKYCVYQDRCHSDVRTKLIKMKIYGDDLEDIIADLITDDFLDEERYAISYTRGKYRQSKWGRNKIKQALKAKQVSIYCINTALKTIDDIEYMEILQRQLEKRYERKKDLTAKAAYFDLVKYGQSRGYTYEECKMAAKDVVTSWD